MVRPVDGVAQLFGQLDPLGLAAGEGGGALPELEIVQADVVQRSGASAPVCGTLAKKASASRTSICKHVGNGLALVGHRQRLAVEAAPVAVAAGNPDIGQKVHLDAFLPMSLAGLTAPSLHVEAEAIGTIAARSRLRRTGKELANLVEDLDVGGGIRARRPSDWLLGDVDDVVAVLDTLDPVVRTGNGLGIMVGLGERGIKSLRDQAALAAAADAGDAGHETDGIEAVSTFLRLCMRAPTT